jgi:DNA-binding transcriptional regulator GbsR (MarR family)
MSYDLIGDLSKARLFDLINPLVDGKKSGMVVIEGADPAEFYVEGGNIVHAKTDTRAGEEAILAIMDLDNGRVRFDWQVSPEKRTVAMVTEQLMSNWAEREEEWRKIKTVVPSSDAVFSMVVDNGGGDKTILEKQWGVLALCNGMLSVSEVAGQLGRSMFEVSQTIRELLSLAILKEVDITGIPKARPKKTIDETFFVTLETELKKVMGPIARVIMSDTLSAFEESRDAFPKDRVESFIGTICDQIVEDQKCQKFAKAAYVAWLSSREND